MSDNQQEDKQGKSNVVGIIKLSLENDRAGFAVSDTMTVKMFDFLVFAFMTQVGALRSQVKVMEDRKKPRILIP